MFRDAYRLTADNEKVAGSRVSVSESLTSYEQLRQDQQHSTTSAKHLNVATIALRGCDRACCYEDGECQDRDNYSYK